MRSGLVKLHLRHALNKREEILKKAISDLPHEVKQEILQDENIQKYVSTGKKTLNVTVLVISPSKVYAEKTDKGVDK